MVPRTKWGRGRNLVAAAGSGLVVLVAASARAGDRAKLLVSIEPGECPTAPLDQVVSLAKIELRNQLLETPAGAAYRITVSCAGERVSVEARAADGAGRARTSDLGGVAPSMRPRIVALAIAELVHDLELSPVEPREAESRRTPLVLPEPPARRPVQSMELAAFAQASTFGFDRKWLLGGGIGGAYARGNWAAGLDAAIASRDERFATGQASVLVTYLAPYAALRWTAGHFAAQLGSGFAFGVARISGDAEDPLAQSGTLTSSWGAPFGFGSISYSPNDVVTFGVRAHAGWVTLPVVGLVWKGPEIDLRGVWSGAQLAIALAL
jgi:hypothetical protein